MSWHADLCRKCICMCALILPGARYWVPDHGSKRSSSTITAFSVYFSQLPQPTKCRYLNHEQPLRRDHMTQRKKTPRVPCCINGASLHTNVLHTYPRYGSICTYEQCIHFRLGKKSDTNDQVMMLPVEKGGKNSFKLPPLGFKPDIQSRVVSPPQPNGHFLPCSA